MLCTVTIGANQLRQFFYFGGVFIISAIAHISIYFFHYEVLTACCSILRLFEERFLF